MTPREGQLEARVSVLESLVREALVAAGKSAEELYDAELEAHMDYAARTGNHKPMQNYLKDKIQRQRVAA